MKRILLLLTNLNLTACIEGAIETLSGEAIQTAIAQAQAAQPTNATAPTDTLIPTSTPELTYTASLLPSNNPTITLTPAALLPDIPVAASVPTGTKQEIGQVIEVVDGDTVTARTEDGDFRVRYIGMDTPERDDICGPIATTKNRELVNWQYIVMVKDVSETERYERLLRYVFVDNIFVNYELVIQGYASAATYPPDVACESIFVEAERCKAGRTRLLETNTDNQTHIYPSTTDPTTIATAATDTTAK